MSSTPEQERRARPDRRAGDRRGSEGRRASDAEGHFGLVPAFWALVGGLVVAYLFFVVLGSVKPSNAPVASGIALGLAVLWLVHSWRRLMIGSRSPKGDRERRGF